MNMAASPICTSAVGDAAMMSTMRERVDTGDLIDRLRSLIGSVALADRQLPSEPSLATQLGASRPALREALVRLETEGLLSRRHGTATTINRDGQRIPARFDQQVEFSDVITAAGHTAGLEVLSSTIAAIDPVSAEQLGVPEGSNCLRTVKRWTADGEPVLIAVDDVPIPDGVSTDGLRPGASLFDNVRALHGHPVEWEIARPGAVTAAEICADWSEGIEGALLTLDLLGLDRFGTRLYRAVEYHVPGAVEFGFVRSLG